MAQRAAGLIAMFASGVILSAQAPAPALGAANFEVRGGRRNKDSGSA
jgi:hypothetical protein